MVDRWHDSPTCSRQASCLKQVAHGLRQGKREHTRTLHEFATARSGQFEMSRLKSTVNVCWNCGIYTGAANSPPAPPPPRLTRTAGDSPEPLHPVLRLGIGPATGAQHLNAAGVLDQMTTLFYYDTGRASWFELRQHVVTTLFKSTVLCRVKARSIFSLRLRVAGPCFCHVVCRRPRTRRQHTHPCDSCAEAQA